MFQYRKFLAKPNKIAILGGLAIFFCLSLIIGRPEAAAVNFNPETVSIAPSSGTSIPNRSVTFTATFTDANGWQDIKHTHLVINSILNGRKCFYGYYNQNTNKFYLRNDDNTEWLGGFTPGSPNNTTIENSYVKLDCAKSSVKGSDNTLIVNWVVSFKPPFTGAKNAYLFVRDDPGAESGFIQKGTWAIPNTPPLVGAITPLFGTASVGQTVIFSISYFDADGWQNILCANLLVNTSMKGVDCFYAYYNQNTNKLYLRNDADTVWLGGYAPGSVNVIENSYCKLDCSKVTVSGNKTVLTINWAVIFKTDFAGIKNTYLYAKDYAEAYNGWAQKGDFCIILEPIPPP